MFEGFIEDYRVRINESMDRIVVDDDSDFSPEWKNRVNLVLDWVSERPGEEVWLHEVMNGVGLEAKDALASVAPLRGFEQMIEWVLVIKMPDGQFVHEDDIEYVDGNGRVKSTGGEVPFLREKLLENAYLRLKIANFQKAPLNDVSAPRP